MSPRRPLVCRSRLLWAQVLLIGVAAGWTAPSQGADVGQFEHATDVGAIDHPGSSRFDPATGTYRVEGSGGNMWFDQDAFHFLYKRASGDLSVSFDVQWVGPGKVDHRKACGVVRQDLEPDSPYVDVAVHGDGLIGLQYRSVKGALTTSVETPIRAPATVLLERTGDVFTLSAARPGSPFQPVGSIAVTLTDPVLVGLAVCAHDADITETALFTNVKLTERPARPGEKRVRETSLHALDIATGAQRLVYRERGSFEAPNWSATDETFYINRDGLMCTLPVAGGELTTLDTGEVTRCNNDHGLSPDGRLLAISASVGREGSQIFVMPAAGGTPRLITPQGPSYWHGWSPDGETLVYCAQRDDNFDIYAIPSAGGDETRLTTAEGLDDGPEYTPDGAWVYFQSERTGLMKLWRMRPDGSEQEQVTRDPDHADWFPHPSPDGKWIAFLSYDRSVSGHPADQNVVLRLMPSAGGQPRVIATLFGGQGTMNVPSWSPDSKSIAFVSYRYVLP